MPASHLPSIFPEFRSPLQPTSGPTTPRSPGPSPPINSHLPPTSRLQPLRANSLVNTATRPPVRRTSGHLEPISARNSPVFDYILPTPPPHCPHVHATRLFGIVCLRAPLGSQHVITSLPRVTPDLHCQSSSPSRSPPQSLAALPLIRPWSNDLSPTLYPCIQRYRCSNLANTSDPCSSTPPPVLPASHLCFLQSRPNILLPPAARECPPSPSHHPHPP
ncbi:hypothetical protein B0H13DRAFT_2330451 [Mycena leptocephala]|nr:hypothetical protein B0H13DRAFT_2330451 [Mycena leptocephala]